MKVLRPTLQRIQQPNQTPVPNTRATGAKLFVFIAAFGLSCLPLLTTIRWSGQSMETTIFFPLSFQHPHKHQSVTGN